MYRYILIWLSHIIDENSIDENSFWREGSKIVCYENNLVCDKNRFWCEEL